MNTFEVILVLLLVMAVLLDIAYKLKMPYPVLLVLGGLAIGFIPGLLDIELEPDVVFLLFLPPIIQQAAFFTPIRDFRRNLRPIGLLAIGLVLFTTCVVAVVAYLVIGFSWPVCFVLGAILAPTDAVAATSIASRLHLPQRIVTILEGESLVNDATALVAYRVAIGAVGGSFSFFDAGRQFVVAAVGGVIIGLALAYVYNLLLRLVDDTSVTLILSFLVGYGAYLLAEQVHASGVIAVVALGIMQGRFWRRQNNTVVSAQTRVQVELVWDSIISLFNSLLFILVGLQLPFVTKQLHLPVETLAFYAIVIALACIGSRLVWVPPATYLPRFLFAKIRNRDPYPSLAGTSIVAWTGMRGVVSLAAALALPEIAPGVEFPGRPLIIFLTFCVILVTVIAQGLSLPFIIRALGIVDDGKGEKEEIAARLAAAQAARARLSELAEQPDTNPEVIADLTRHYDRLIRRFEARANGTSNSPAEEWATIYAHLQQELLETEFATVVAMHDKGTISDEVLGQVQRELDLGRMRLSQDHDESDHESVEARTE